MTRELIDEKKKAFADKYSKAGTPAALAILAASQHNPLYSKGLNAQKKKKIKDEWESQLNLIGKRYETHRTRTDFISDITEFCKHMNDMFAEDFNNTRQPEYDKGFRISHAQKSLSIYLKHLWCREKCMPVPPVCPIDGNVLKWVKIRQAWTKCNSIADKPGIVDSGYESQLETVSTVAEAEFQGFSMFEWELCKWESDAEKKGNMSDRSQPAVSNHPKGFHYVKGNIYDHIEDFEIDGVYELYRPGREILVDTYLKEHPSSKVQLIREIYDDAERRDYDKDECLDLYDKKLKELVKRGCRSIATHAVYFSGGFKNKDKEKIIRDFLESWYNQNKSKVDRVFLFDLEQDR